MEQLAPPQLHAHRDKILKRIAVAVPVSLVLLYLAAGAAAAETLTKPKRQFSPENNPAKFGLAYEEVRFLSRGDNMQVAGWYMPFRSSTRAIVLVQDCGACSSLPVSQHRMAGSSR